MQEQLNILAKSVEDKRKAIKLSLHKASISCGMRSNSGLKSLENGMDCKITTLLRVSKGLKINFSIIDGKIKIINIK